MTRGISRWWWLAAIVVVLTLWRVPAAGQSTASPDVLNALLTEVRGLRAAMEQMAAAGPRVQLAMGRLHLQEQRLNTMLRRLDEIREKLSGAEREAAEHREQLVRMQEAAVRSTDPDERQAVQSQAVGLKKMLEHQSAEVQRLRTEETELAGSVATEQARWVEINQRLEDLDRALIKR